jgi:clan AA aspartic protease
VSPGREAIIGVRVRGPSGVTLDLDAVVDTGFTGSVTLPNATVAALGLVRRTGGAAVLADGSPTQFDVYAAEIEWHSTWRPVLVSAVGNEVLLGMRLLAGHELRIVVIPGGVVEVTALP